MLPLFRGFAIGLSPMSLAKEKGFLEKFAEFLFIHLKGAFRVASQLKKRRIG